MKTQTSQNGKNQKTINNKATYYVYVVNCDREYNYQHNRILKIENSNKFLAFNGQKAYKAICIAIGIGTVLKWRSGSRSESGHISRYKSILN